MELLFHLKINNLNCGLQIYVADTRMKISLDFKIMEAEDHLFRQFSNESF